MTEESYELIIRQPVAKDAQAMQLFLKQLKETVPYLTIDYLEDIDQQTELIEQYLHADRHLMLIVECNEDIVGIANLVSLETNYGEIGLALLPDFQNLGLGQDLIEGLIDFGSNIGLKGLILTVEADNTGAIRFYLRNGFKNHSDAEETTWLMTYQF